MEKETKNCQNCKKDFQIEPEDFEFYKKIDVPPPTWCPECRLMRRLIWRNDRSLYKRSCDLCKNQIIAMYPADAKFPVYCQNCWYGDGWDGTTYGREYDFSKPFFTQFHELLQVTPQIALQVSTSPGSDYVNQVANCKNCYLIASGSDNEDCSYCYRVLNSKNVIDSSFVEKVESSYQCLACMESSNLLFAENCIGSSHLTFCIDTHSSQDCFMSSNLRRASYVFRGEKVTKEDFVNRMKAVDLGSYKELERYKKEFKELRDRSLYKYMMEKSAPGATGTAITNAKNAKHCFMSGNLENCSYCLMVVKTKDAMDINNGCCVMELMYECSTTGVNAYNVKLSADVWPEVRNTSYSQSCRNGANNLFGCISLRKKEYCILNKQYSKEEYESLIPKIIAHMNEMPYKDKKGRIYPYGEFFPPELSLFAYNETPAQDYFPKTKPEVEEAGFGWKSIESKTYEISIAPENLPDHVKDVSDTITKEIIGCEHGGTCHHQCPGAFRITADELKFYRKMNLALPRICSNCRRYERFALVNPYRLWKRQCLCMGIESKESKYKNTVRHFHENAPCPNTFETSYAPDRPEIVYCETCYNAEVV